MRRVLYATVVLAVLVAAVVALVMWRRWANDAPRREAATVLSTLDQALRSANDQDVLRLLAIPPALTGRTVPEQAEFVRKALADEISPEGLAVMVRDGGYGPLSSVFPEAGAAWASHAGVKASDCVAFRLERNGIEAQVVLATNVSPFRIVRCNNVKQMALPVP